MTESTPQRPARRLYWLRRHWPFAIAFTGGLLLRVVTIVAYPQAYFINDSRGYVHAAQTLVPQESRQSGVALFYRLIPDWERLTTVTAVQHVLGLGLAVLMYVVLRRRGVVGWAATVATLPVLVDPFQLTLEHYILTDFLFELLVSAGLLLLVAWRRLPTWAAAVAGVLLGLSLVVRGVGDLVVVVVAVIVGIGQARWRPAVALLAAAVVPVVGYMGWYHHTYGRYSTGSFPSYLLYGRVMTALDCADLDLPANERVLCVRAPAAKAKSQDWYVWNRHSGLNQLYAAEGHAASHLVSDFNRRAIRQQPLRYAGATLLDVAKGFAPRRSVAWSNRAPDPWLFSTGVKRTELVTELTGDRSPRLHPRLARLMTADNELYFPGPVFAAALLLALLSVVFLGRRGGGQRSAIAVLAVPALLLLLTPALVTGFSWRYQLLQLSLIPPAAALAATAVVRARRGAVADGTDPDTEADTGDTRLAERVGVEQTPTS